MPTDSQKQVVVDAFNVGAKLGALDGRFVKLATMAMQMVGLELAQNVRPGDRASLCVPVSVDNGSKVNPGAILLLEHRVVVAWSEGILHPRPRSLAYDLADISNVETFKRKSGRVSAQLDAISFDSPEGTVEIILHSEVGHGGLNLWLIGVLTGAFTFNWDDETPKPDPVARMDPDDATLSFDDADDLREVFLLADPRELERSLRKKLGVALEGLEYHCAHEEIVGLAACVADDAPGLLAATEDRILFFDMISGILDIEFDRDQSSVARDGSSLVVKDSEGFVRFSYLEPSVLGGPPPEVVLAQRRAALPPLRICEDCEAEFTALFVGDRCPDCGGLLVAPEAAS